LNSSYIRNMFILSKFLINLLSCSWNKQNITKFNADQSGTNMLHELQNQVSKSKEINGYLLKHDHLLGILFFEFYAVS
jgi:ABC-type uncharacterized transport system involved in gliding motility auxiliary subunit